MYLECLLSAQSVASAHLQEDHGSAVAPPDIFSVLGGKCFFQLYLLTTIGFFIPIILSHFGFSSIRGRYLNVSVLESVLVPFLSAVYLPEGISHAEVPESLGSSGVSAAHYQGASAPSAVPSAASLLSLLVMQSIGETLRPLWGLMDKCYPVATQVGEAGALLPEGAAVLGALSWVDSLRGLVGGLVVGARLPARMHGRFPLQRRRVRSGKKQASEVRGLPGRAGAGLSGSSMRPREARLKACSRGGGARVPPGKSAPRPPTAP